MPKPFANSAQITYSLVNGDWLLGIQTGNSTGDAGLPQMKHIKLSQLSDWVRGTYGQVWRYRGPFSASLPSDAQANDYFLATATFTVDGVTYTKDHLYAYNASGTWDDISDILTQYASQSQVTDIDDRLTVVEVKVDAMGDGVVYKGEVATYADLAGIVDPQAGWEYFVTANASFYIYNGSSWDQIDNGIVQTITDGDVSHAPSGDAVYDALASEASARESADTDLKAALSATNKRVTNLEQKAGDELPINYPHVTYGMDEVPASVAQYAKASKLKGVTRVANQLVKNHSFGTGDTSDWSLVGGSGVVSNNKLTITSSSLCALYQGVQPIQGHAYLFSVDLNTTNSEMTFGIYRNSSGYKVTHNPAANVNTKMIVLATIDESVSGYSFDLRLRINNSNATTVVCSDFLFKDLSQYFNTTDLSFLGATDSDKLATIQRDYPELLIPSDYDTGTRVDTTYSAVVSKGFNLWNEVWELGVYNAVTGEKYPNDQRIRSASYIDVTPNTSYYAKVPSPFEINIFFYDENKNFLYNVGKKNTTFDAPPNCRYITFYVGGGDITSYGNNICINISGTEDGTYKSYRDPVTLTLPSPVTGKSAGSVHQIYYPETGEMTEPLGSYTFTGVEGWTANGDNQYTTPYLNLPRPLSEDYWSVKVGNLLLDGLVADTQGRIYSGAAKMAIGFTDSLTRGGICISADVYADRQTLLTGKTLLYERATPNPNSQATEPVLDPFLKVEGGGTIQPVQTQTTQIDSAMSVDYLGV